MTAQNSSEEGKAAPAPDTGAEKKGAEKKNEAGPQAAPAPAPPPKGTADDLLSKLKEILPRVEPGGESGITLNAVGTINSNSQYVHGDSHSQSSTAGRDVLIVHGNIIFGPPRDDLIRTAEDDRAAAGPSPDVVFAGELESWWESGQPAAEDLCHVVALAFLEGSDFRSISRYAAELRELIRPPRDSGRAGQRKQSAARDGIARYCPIGSLSRATERIE